MSGYNPHHTVELDLNSKLLRYYVKTWDARVEENADVNLCKMFWGVLFSPLVWFLRIISWPIRKIIPEPKPFEYKSLAELDAEREERERKRAESKWMKALGKIANFMGKAAPKLKYVAYVVWVLYLAWVLVLVVIAFIKYTITMLLALAVTAVVIALGAALLKLSDAGKLGWVGRSANKVKNTVVFFAKFMWSGVMAVKSATCPRIVVKSDG